MGCDIHIRVQVRRGDAQAKRVACVAARLNGACDDGEWETLLPPVCKWDYEGGTYYRSWYHERNYTVFGVLAGVRNRDVARIAEPRGLPPGVDPEDTWLSPSPPYHDPEGDARVEYCRDDLGDHSFTWYLASELLEAPQWHTPQRRDGVLSPREYRRLREEGAPHAWSGDVAGLGVKVVDAGEMDRLVAAGIVDTSSDDERGVVAALWPSARGTDGVRYYVRCEWDEPQGTQGSCRDFIDWMARELAPLAEKHGASNVRVVVGFDS